jgi:hypothetical protein
MLDPCSNFTSPTSTSHLYRTNPCMHAVPGLGHMHSMPVLGRSLWMLHRVTNADEHLSQCTYIAYTLQLTPQLAQNCVYVMTILMRFSSFVVHGLLGPGLVLIHLIASCIFFVTFLPIRVPPPNLLAARADSPVGVIGIGVCLLLQTTNHISGLIASLTHSRLAE